MDDQVLQPVTNGWMRDAFQFVFRSTGKIETRKYSNSAEEPLTQRILCQKGDELKSKKASKKTANAEKFWSPSEDPVLEKRLKTKKSRRQGRFPTKSLFDLVDLDDGSCSDYEENKAPKKRKRNATKAK